MAEDTETAPDDATEPEVTPDPPAKPDDAKPTPPAAPPKPAAEATVSRSEFNALAAQLRTATREAQERKKALDDLAAANATEAEKAIIKARQESAAEREAVLRPAVVRANARAALSSAGCTDKGVQTTLMRLIDSAAVDLGEDGEIVGGLDEQVESLKAQFPEKFEVKKPRIPSAREVDAGDKKPPAVKKSATQLAVDRLTGA